MLGEVRQLFLADKQLAECKIQQQKSAKLLAFTLKIVLAQTDKFAVQN